MKWYAPGQETFTKEGDAWVIKDPEGNTEVEGVDYLKTYYRLSLTNCTTCSSVLSTVCETDSISSPECHPYTYDASKRLYLGGAVPYFQGHPDSTPPVPPDPKNHLIYSFYDSGQAEILKFDHDAQGTYFLWKAYTEWGAYPPIDIIFSRTGLGYLLLKLFIQSGGNELCQVETIVKVDCCEKAADRRKVEIWWEDFGTCQPYIMYSGVLYDAICKMPTEVSIGGASGLVWYGCTYPQQPLYAIPEINGSCLPVEWTLSGPISLWNSDKNDNIVYFKCANDMGCNEEATITLRDRCGSVYVVRGKPCCEEATALSISYTSLSMSCGQQQTFTAKGGCSPYLWSITGGGGSITQEGVYTAPATNVNCVDNPTIQVTDCCGNTASINLAINCVEQGVALGFVHWLECSGCWCVDRGCDQGVISCFDWINDEYDCAGNLYSHCETRPCGTGNPPCNGNTSGWHKVDCDICSPSGCPPTSCYTNQCGCITYPNCPCDTLIDGRSDADKANGCCPLNPFTGLPYD
jgi:hypothetical protein